MRKSIIFPGQGSQYVGMGLDFFRNFKEAKDVYLEVDDVLNYNLSRIIFEGSVADINLTANTQPAIMATGVAIFKVLKKNIDLKINDFSFCAGHSLGEYTALVCSESLSLKEASLILKARGNAMQNAVKPGDGGMAAILGAEVVDIENFLSQTNFYTIEISNDNCPGQVVISGEKNEIDRCCQEIKNKILKKSLPLPVSAPFHCKLMIPASENIKNLILDSQLNDPKIPLVSNVNALETSDSNIIKNLLVDQIYKRVRWRETMEYMFNHQVTEFVEIGPGKTLTGMLKRFKKEVLLKNFSSIEDLG